MFIRKLLLAAQSCIRIAACSSCSRRVCPSYGWPWKARAPSIGLLSSPGRSWTRPTPAGMFMPTGGYPSDEREAWLKANGHRNRIQRRGHRNKPLCQTQQGRNHRIAKTRAWVEHAFAAIERMGQADPNHWSGACQLCHYDNGGLLQPEAAGVLPAGGHRDRIAPKRADLPLPTARRSENSARLLGKAANC